MYHFVDIAYYRFYLLFEIALERYAESGCKLMPPSSQSFGYLVAVYISFAADFPFYLFCSQRSSDEISYFPDQQYDLRPIDILDDMQSICSLFLIDSIRIQFILIVIRIEDIALLLDSIEQEL